MYKIICKSRNLRLKHFDFVKGKKMKNEMNNISVYGNADKLRKVQFPSNISRRSFIKSSLTALTASLIVGCQSSPTATKPEPITPRLSARPGTPTQTATTGLTKFGLGSGRDGVLYVPSNYSPNKAMPFFIALHGAGGSSSDWKNYYDRAEARGIIFMAPDSRGTTWDMIRGDYGPDVIFLDHALNYVFDHCNIDPAYLLLSGFSDGASYALSLGLSNGDLFSHLIGYSPGFLLRTNPIVGKPKIYISHGTNDTVLPVEYTRDTIVTSLRNTGYDVTYNEFTGSHEVPASVSEAALDWFLHA
jgi:phospholipase/carboxylesterase